MMRVGFFTGNKATSAVDTYFGNVVLLLHMDGTAGSTTFTDNSINAKTTGAAGNTQISTTNKKFGTGGGSFNSGYLNVTGSSDFQFGTGDFTVEFWIYPTSIPNPGAIMFNNLFYIALESPSKISFTSVFTLTFNDVLSNTWTHIAFSKSASVVRAFKNGVLVNSISDTASHDIPGNFQLGQFAEYGAWQFPGYIDDFRITKGVGRYVANFDVPTAAFPNSGPPGNTWFSVMGTTYWTTSGMTGTGPYTDSGIMVGDGLLSNAVTLYGSATKIRITYTNVGTSSPAISDIYGTGLNSFFPQRGTGTWTDEATINWTMGADTFLTMDSADSGLSSVSITNIEVLVG